MDPIHIAPARLTQMGYLRLLVRIWVGRVGWIYGVFLLIGIWAILNGSASFMAYGVLLCTLPLIRLGLLYQWTARKDNQRVYEERRFVLDEEKLVGTTPGGGRSEIPWSYVQRMVEVDGRYLLYISAGQMIILDKAAFPDGAAEQRFLGWVGEALKK